MIIFFFIISSFVAIIEEAFRKAKEVRTLTLTLTLTLTRTRTRARTRTRTRTLTLTKRLCSSPRRR